MRRHLILAAFCVLAQGLPSSVLAQHIETGRILSIDTVSMNFVCQTRHGLRQYWVKGATRFVTQGPRGSFFDLKTGQRVHVASHGSGRLAIADIVSGA
jgi:hypothetical protein